MPQPVLTVPGQAVVAPATPALSRRRRLWAWALAHPVLTAVLVAAIVRIGFSVGVFLVKGGALFGDETTYSGMAYYISSGRGSILGDFEHRLFRETSTFMVPLTALFWVFGPNTLVGQLLSGAFAVAAAGATTRFALEFSRRSVALGAGLVMALMPSQVLFSILILKDSAAWALLALLGLVVVVWPRFRGWQLAFPAAGAAVLVFLLGHIREHSTVAATWAFVLACIFLGWRQWTRWLPAVGVGVLVPLLLGLGPMGTDLILHHGSLEERRANNAENARTAFVPDRSTLNRRTAQAGGSGSVDNTPTTDTGNRPETDTGGPTTTTLSPDAGPGGPTSGQSVDDFLGKGTTGTSSELSQLPLGLRVLILDPLPWASTDNSRVRMAQAENLLWYPLLLLAAVGVWSARRRLGSLWYPLLLSAMIAGMYALSEGNFGTAFRHRGEYVWAMIVMAAAGGEALLTRFRDDVRAG